MNSIGTCITAISGYSTVDYREYGTSRSTAVAGMNGTNRFTRSCRACLRGSFRNIGYTKLGHKLGVYRYCIIHTVLSCKYRYIRHYQRATTPGWTMHRGTVYRVSRDSVTVSVTDRRESLRSVSLSLSATGAGPSGGADNTARKWLPAVARVCSLRWPSRRPSCRAALTGLVL